MNKQEEQILNKIQELKLANFNSYTKEYFLDILYLIHLNKKYLKEQNNYINVELELLLNTIFNSPSIQISQSINLNETITNILSKRLLKGD